MVLAFLMTQAKFMHVPSVILEPLLLTLTESTSSFFEPHLTYLLKNSSAILGQTRDPCWLPGKCTCRAKETWERDHLMFNAEKGLKVNLKRKSPSSMAVILIQ